MPGATSASACCTSLVAAITLSTMINTHQRGLLLTVYATFKCRVASMSVRIVSPPFPTRADVFLPNHSKRHRVTHNTHACWAPLLTATLHTLQASRQDAAKQALQNLFEGAKDILAVNEKAELEAQRAAGGGGGSGGKGGGDSGGGDGFNWRGGPGDYWHAFCNCAHLTHSLPAALQAHCA